MPHQLHTYVFPLRVSLQIEGCVTNHHTTGSFKTQLCTAKFSFMEVMSVALVYIRSTNPPRRSLVHSQWQCEVFPSVPRKIHTAAGPIG